MSKSLLEKHEPKEQQTLEEIMLALRELHARNHAEPDDLSSTKHLVECLSENQRRLLQATLTLHRIDNGMPRDGELHGEQACEMEGITRATAMASFFNHVYSTDGHNIKTQRLGRLLVAQEIEHHVMESASPESLKQVGLVAFDMNGTRSIRELVGHTKTGVLLQGIARVLTEKESSTRLWLERNGLHVTPIATGGDEFAILLRGNSPLSNELLQATGAGYQQAIADDPILRKSVNLNQPHMHAKFKEPLPDECPITVAHGAATLDEGILWAREQDDDDHRLLLNGDESFTEACAKIYAGTLDVADSRQKKNKRAFKKHLATTNPQLARLLTRTRESQDLMSRLQDGKALVTNSLTTLRELFEQFQTWARERTEEDEEALQE